MIRPKSIRPMQAAKTGYIILSAALCILGTVLIIFPRFSALGLGILTGILMIAFGIVKLIGYFSKDLYRLAFQYDLALGILSAALGIVMLLETNKAMSFICVVLGILILADGLFKIQIAVDSKRFGIRLWWLILALAILTGMVGTLLVFRPSESVPVLMVLLGISLLSEGILNVSTVLTAVKIIRHQMPDIIEADYDEVRKED